METKQCIRCNEVKPIEMFAKSNRKPTTFRGAREVGRTIYRSECKKCASEYAIKFREAHPGYTSRAAAEARKLAKSELLKYSPLERSFSAARICDAKARAAKKGVPFDIDTLYMLSIYTGICALTGLPLVMEKGSLDIASIDRIVPEKGYTKGNVRWVSWKVNRAKGEMSDSDLISLCRAVLESAETIRKE